MSNIDSRNHYRPDNDDCAPEGNTFSQINRLLNQPGSGSIQQVARACVDDSGTKVSSNSDETDETNNYEGFVLLGEPTGSLGATLQGRNHKKNGLLERMETRFENSKHTQIIESENEYHFNNEQFLEKRHDDQQHINEHLYPFSTIPKP